MAAEADRLRGNLQRAEDGYREASRRGHDPQPGLAVLRLAQGRADAAASAIRRAADENHDRVRRPGVLAAHVEIMLAVGDVPGARASCDELTRIAAASPAPVLVATAAARSGAVRLADHDARGALADLRRAWRIWQDLEVPYEAARARVLLGSPAAVSGTRTPPRWSWTRRAGRSNGSTRRPTSPSPTRSPPGGPRPCLERGAAPRSLTSRLGLGCQDGVVVTETDVCIVGGGPAGMMLGLLLARQGVAVTVLEKHVDFLRDFRGDTVHPSTMDVLDELGLASAAAEVPHRDVDELRMTFADGTYRVADFAQLPVAHPYIRFMPQWDFLDVLADAAGELSNFRLLRRHEVVDVLERRGIVRGVRAKGPGGPMDVAAQLTVAADGRGSVVRQRAGLRVTEYGAPMDVLWFRLSRSSGSAEGLDMHFGPGRLLLTIDRGDYWQIAYVIPKGQDEQVRAAGLEEFRRSVAALVPALAGTIGELRGWGEVKTLTVRLDRLRRWHTPGLLCIGDAAHAMSPIGGVGINLAVQDAVCAARMLAEPLRTLTLTSRRLRSIQIRRWYPTAGTQLIQRAAQRFLVGPMLAGDTPVTAPLPLRVLARFPRLQALPARVIGIGLQPERVSPRPTSAAPVARPRRPGSRR